MTTKISTERRGHLLLIGLDRAAKRNAFDVEMLEQFAAAFDELEADEGVRCAVIFAHGDHFTAGLDLANVAPAIQAGRIGLGGAGIDPWATHGKARTKPTVVAVQGLCLTLGIELCLASDVTIASDTARFAQIEVKRGIFPFGGATFRFVQTAGWGNAMRWLLTGDEFTAEEAHRIGLVQEVTPAGRELPRAIEVAETIARQAPLGVRATLASARRCLNEEAAARALMPELQGLMASADAREGMMSFVQRRPAVFSGK
jgi:enoyl-CoA hydratase/carnithine racemase